jgi:hypothetical protein
MCQPAETAGGTSCVEEANNVASRTGGRSLSVVWTLAACCWNPRKWLPGIITRPAVPMLRGISSLAKD